MMLRQLIRRFVPILVAMGIVLAPFSAATSAEAMAPEMMSAMADDMPCRPLGQTTVPDCQPSCPLMAMCMANWLPGAPVLTASTLGFGLRSDAVTPGSDVFRSPLGEQPPARPPRT